MEVTQLIRFYGTNVAKSSRQFARRVVRYFGKAYRRTAYSDRPEEHIERQAEVAMITPPQGSIAARDFQHSLPVRHGDLIELRVHTFRNHAEDRAALLQVEFRTEAGEVVQPVGDLPINPRIGSYIYLPDGHDGERHASLEISFAVPPRSTSLNIYGHQWRAGVTNHITEFDVVAREDDSKRTDELVAFIDGLRADDVLVLIYSTAPPLGHPTLALRPNRLAKEYEDAGAYVIYMPFGSVRDYDARPGPRSIQVEGTRLHETMSMLAGRHGPSTVLICSSYPDVRSALTVDTARKRAWRVVYEVRDEMEEFNRVGYSKWYRAALEARVATRADVVVAVSPRLAGKMNVIAHREDSVVVPNGASDELVDATKSMRDATNMNSRVGTEGSTVGYIGHLTPSWFDWDALTKAARELGNVQFEIIGHGAPSGLSVPDNVKLLGPKTHAECREFASFWTVGLIPFKPSPLTTAVDPNKLYEYLAFGLRVVSAPMGSVDGAPITWVYQQGDQLAPSIREALAYRVSDEDVRHVNEYLDRSRWGARAAEMRSCVGF